MFRAEMNTAVGKFLKENPDKTANPDGQVSQKYVRKTDVATVIGNEYNFGFSTVTKYDIYARAVDDLKQKSPEIAQKILTGKHPCLPREHHRAFTASNRGYKRTETSAGQRFYRPHRLLTAPARIKMAEASDRKTGFTENKEGKSQCRSRNQTDAGYGSGFGTRKP